MTVELACAVAALVVATYLSALTLAMLSFSHTAVRRRLEARGRNNAADWILGRVERASLAISLLRTLARITFFALVLVDIVGVGTEESLLTWTNLAWAAGVATLLLWLCTSVVASAIARYAAEGLIILSLPVLRAVTWTLYPLTRGMAVVDEIVRRLTGANVNSQEQAEAELLRSIEDTQREGGLDQEAAELLENVVEFSSTDVGEVMTPRTDIEGIELTDDLSSIRAFIIEAGHSRIPVYRENLDNIAGILYAKDLLPYLGADPSDFKLQPLLRQPIVVPETKSVREMLADFQQAEVHLAIIVDEYGGTAGLATIEDVLEELVGEIHDEHDPDDESEPELTAIDERQAVVDGRFHIDDLNEQLGLSLPEDEEYDTIAGFVLAQLGRVPRAGEIVESDGARFTTIEATPTHIQRVRVELLAPPTNGRSGQGG